MRFDLAVTLKKPLFPLDYRRTIMSFFKRLLGNYEKGRYLEAIYGKSLARDFCFAVWLDNPRFGKDCVFLGGKHIKIIVSARNMETGLPLFNAALNAVHREIYFEKENSMTIGSITLEQPKKIIHPWATFQFQSPLCLRMHDREENRDRYISILDQNFSQILSDSIRQQCLRNGLDVSLLQIPICFDLTNCTKTVVTHYGQHIETTIGKIVIHAHPQILDEIYRCGIGSRRSAGFGLLRLVQQRESPCGEPGDHKG